LKNRRVVLKVWHVKLDRVSAVLSMSGHDRGQDFSA
jgi:hypothetical protein